MRLPDDDEIYDVDQTYLGPEGKYIGRFRYRALVLGPFLLVMGLVFLLESPIGLGLMSVGLVAIVTLWLTGKIIDHTSTERPFVVLGSTVAHEVRAQREDRRRQRARGSGLTARRIDLGGQHTLGPGRRSWRTYANIESTRGQAGVGS